MPEGFICIFFFFKTLMAISSQVIQSENLAAVMPSSQQRGTGRRSLAGAAILAWHLQPRGCGDPLLSSSVGLCAQSYPAQRCQQSFEVQPW